MLGAGPRVALAGAVRRSRARACDGWPAAPRSAGRRRAAARTAQPGSPVVTAVAEAAAGGEVSDVVEGASRRPRPPPAPRARGCPGVSTRSAPPGSSNSSRWVVVCRPRESESRTSAVRWRSSPSRALTRVDLPTPDEPRIAAVVPGRRCASRSSRPAPVQRRDGDHRDARGDRVDRDQPSVTSSVEVGLVEHDDGRDPRSTRRPPGSARCGAG